MYNKKAQLSVETMIIYGLVILFSLSVLGLLIYFGVLDLGSYLPDSCNIGGTGDLKCEEQKLSKTSDKFELGIRNTGQRPLKSLEVSVTDAASTHFTTLGPIVGTVVVGATVVPISDTNPLSPGDVAVISAVILASDGTVKPGKVLRGTLKTAYEYKDGVITQEASGTIRVKATD